MSDDHKLGFTAIFFVGSVFSPFYAKARKIDEQTNPMDYCAVNLVLYEKKKRLWAFTEWPETRVMRTPSKLNVGTSSVRREATRVEAHFREHSIPGQKPIEGAVRITGKNSHDMPIALDDNARHRWWPMLPFAQIEVDFKEPNFKFSGMGYHDANMGTRPLEADFRSWNWCRATTERETAILYDVNPKNSPPLRITKRFLKSGEAMDFEATGEHRFFRTWWGSKRTIRHDGDFRPKILQTLEDSPFYSRSLIQTKLRDNPCVALHESLSLDRFKNPIVQSMLPYRILVKR